MPKSSVVAGTTGFLDDIFIQDSSKSDGSGLTGVVFNTAGLTAYYKRRGQSTWTQINLATAIVGTFTSGGFIQSDATNAPGMYEVGFPNACFASGATSVKIMFKGAANMPVVTVEYSITVDDPQVAKPTNSSLLSINGSGAVTIDQTAAIAGTPGVGTIGESLFYTSQRTGRRGTAQAGGNNTITLDAGASAVDNTYAGYAIKLTGGTGAGQFATIVSYVGSTKVATITRPGTGGAWVTNPDNTTVFMIDPFPLSILAPSEHTNIAADVLDAAASAHNTSGTIGNKINSAGSAGDPLASAVPGSYGAGTAGYLLGHNLAAAAPTSGQIVTAILAAIADGTVTVADLLKILLAVNTGPATGLGTEAASLVFKSPDGTKNRVSATISGGGARTATTDLT